MSHRDAASPSRSAGAALRGVAKAIAQWTVSAHQERDPSLPDRYGPGWREKWVSDVQQRVGQLAQAVSLGSPDLFVDAVTWSGVAYAARAMTIDDLRTSLECLRETIAGSVNGVAAADATAAIDGALAALQGEPTAPPSPLDPEAPHGRLVLEYLEALLASDRRRAERLVLDAAETGTPVGEIYLDVLCPALAEVGRMWHLGEISIADEHLATAATETIMARLRAHVPEVERVGRTVVVTAVAGESHAIGARMVADFFEMGGWDVVDLGVNMPAADVVEKLAALEGADLLALSVTNAMHLDEAAATIEAVRAEPALAGVRVLVGGPPFRRVPDLWRRVGAAASAASAAEAVVTAGRLVG